MTHLRSSLRENDIEDRLTPVNPEHGFDRTRTIGELKNHCGLDAVPARRLVANQIHLLAGITAHNTARDLQIETSQAKPANSVNRSSLWFFHELGTLPRHLFWQAGRLIRANGRLTLALADNEFMKRNFLRMREALAQ